MPSALAASTAFAWSREEIAAISLHSPFCIPGKTFLTPIAAVLRTPQRTFLFAISNHDEGYLRGRATKALLVDDANAAPAYQLLDTIDEEPVCGDEHIVRLQYGAEFAGLFEVQQ